MKKKKPSQKNKQNRAVQKNSQNRTAPKNSQQSLNPQKSRAPQKSPQQRQKPPQSKNRQTQATRKSQNMPSKKSPKKADPQSPEALVLPRILGIAPSRYLVYLFALLVLSLLFLVLLLPGILRNGTVFELWSNAQNAEIRVGGERMGALPGAFFIERGMQEITLSKYGFREHSQQINVGGRLFFSLFAPRRETLIIPLEPDPAISAESFAQQTLVDIAGWGFQSTSAVRQAPPLYDSYALDSLARRSLPNSSLSPNSLPSNSLASSSPPPQSQPPQNPDDDQRLSTVLEIIGSDQQFRDILRGTARIESESIVPNAYGLSSLIKKGIGGLNERSIASVREFAGNFLSAGLLNDLAAGNPSADTSAESTSAAPPTSSAESPESATSTNNTPSTSAQSTAELLATLQALGYTGELVNTGRSLVMDSPVSYGFFQEFMAESDVWTEGSAEMLEAQGLSTANRFMQTPTGQALHSLPSERLRSANLLAISAFIHWLSGYTPAGVRIRLPHPQELRSFHNSDVWEYSSHFAHAHQSAETDLPLLRINYAEIRARAESIMRSGDASAPESASPTTIAQNYTLLDAPVQVQNAAGNVGILSARMVSPVTGFRLVFEFDFESAPESTIP